MEERTLCKKCAESYREAGYTVTADGYQPIRSPCDLCMRSGINYTIIPQKEVMKD